MSTRKIVGIVVLVGLVALVVGLLVGAVIGQAINGGGQTTFWKIAGIVGLAGLSGGVINSLLSDSGFFLPGMQEVKGRRIFKPGALGNAFLGAAAAFISWGLYGPFTEYVVIPAAVDKDSINLTLGTLVGAIVAGSGGSRLITSALDKRVLSETAATAAGRQGSPDNAARIATAASPTEALRTARQMPRT